MERITKAKFQQLLNASDIEDRKNKPGEITNGFRNNQYAQRTRLYGDYVRSQDPEMFNDMYRRYHEGDKTMESLAEFL